METHFRNVATGATSSLQVKMAHFDWTGEEGFQTVRNDALTVQKTVMEMQPLEKQHTETLTERHLHSHESCFFPAATKKTIRL